MGFANLFQDGLVGIIYDCDGVMIDSAYANRFLYDSIMRELDLPPVTGHQIKYCLQATFQQAMKYLVPPELHDKIDKAVATAIDYDKDILPKIELMPGYRHFVEECHARGLRQAIDTNRTDFGIMRILEHFNLPDYFNPVISSSIADPKPLPQGVKMICSDWHCKPEQTLFVGDSPDDRAAAKGAGAVFAAFGSSDLTGDIHVESWAALAKLLWPGDNAGDRQ